MIRRTVNRVIRFRSAARMELRHQKRQAAVGTGFSAAVFGSSFVLDLVEEGRAALPVPRAFQSRPIPGSPLRYSDPLPRIHLFHVVSKIDQVNRLLDHWRGPLLASPPSPGSLRSFAKRRKGEVRCIKHGVYRTSWSAG